MTETRIQQFYKVGSLATIGVGLIYIFIPFESSSIHERIWPAILINVGFHMMFQILSRMPFGIYRTVIIQNSKIKILGTIMLKIWLITALVLTAVATIMILKVSFSQADYNKLLLLPVFFAIVIGLISSWNKIMAK